MSRHRFTPGPPASKSRARGDGPGLRSILPSAKATGRRADVVTPAAASTTSVGRLGLGKQKSTLDGGQEREGKPVGIGQALFPALAATCARARRLELGRRVASASRIQAQSWTKIAAAVCRRISSKVRFCRSARSMR